MLHIQARMLTVTLLWLSPFLLATLAREEEKGLRPKEENMSKFLDELVKGYDMRLRPNFGGDPVLVTVGLWVMSVDSINVIDMDYRLDFFIRQLWMDSRLKHSYPRTLSLSNSILSQIWVPDTYFANSKSSSFHKVTAINKMISVSQEGLVHYNARITVKASCPMDLRMFPFDKQQCSLQMESYGYGSHEVIYQWENRTDRGVALNKKTGRLPQYDVTAVNTSSHFTMYIAGRWSGLKVSFTLLRSRGYFFIHIFAPCALIVILSWISFCIPPESTAARIALGITSVLTITTILNNVNTRMPKVSYIKAIDWYMIGCFLFVFSVLLEYTMVLYIINVHNKRKIKLGQMMHDEKEEEDDRQHEGFSFTKLKDPSKGHPSPSCTRKTKLRLESNYFKEKYNTFCETPKRSNQPCTKTRPGRGSADEDWGQLITNPNTATCKATAFWFDVIDTDCIDGWARVSFPICFTAFNTIYWFYYLFS